jgi:hypothetical protein
MAKSKLEVNLENWCVDYAWDTYGIEGIKMKFAERAGDPDRLFLLHGSSRVLWVEYKRLGKPLRPLQAHRHKELREWGHDVETCDNKEDGKRIIDEAATKAGIKCLANSKEVGSKKIPAPRRAIPAFKRMRRALG